MKRIYVAATGQNVGKTALSLGLLAGLSKRYGRIGFLKPVGQEHVELEGARVDKDVALFRTVFDLKAPAQVMSPVLFTSGTTRTVLDGKLTQRKLEEKILSAVKEMEQLCDVCVIEGTGHLGVGSVAGISCAHVAKLLDASIIIVVGGGIGKTLDRLALAEAIIGKEGADVRGVILNQVLDTKREQTLEYVQKGLERWKWPLLGAVPYAPFLAAPTMSDYAALFKSTLISGTSHALRHFTSRLLAAGPMSLIEKQIKPGQLVIATSSREDLIRHVSEHPAASEIGLILTGSAHPTPEMVSELQKSDLPALYTEMPSYFALEKITGFVSKFQPDDKDKVKAAIEVIEPHIDFDKLWN